jgi:hypothetical protein
LCVCVARGGGAVAGAVLGSLVHEPTGNFGSPCNFHMAKLLLHVEETLMIPMFEHHFTPFHSFIPPLIGEEMDKPNNVITRRIHK